MKKLILICSMLFFLIGFTLIIPSYAKAKVTLEEYDIYIYRKKEELITLLTANTVESNLPLTVYPIEKGPTYDKFMKYTYVISDDSVIGLGFNFFGAREPYSYYLFDNGGYQPHDVTVFGLAPGTATLKIYDGKKLVRHIKYTVLGDTVYSPSSYVPVTIDILNDIIGENKSSIISLTQKKYDSFNKKIQSIAMSAAKKTNIHDRIMVAKSKIVDMNAKVITEQDLKKPEYLTYLQAQSSENFDKPYSIIQYKKALPVAYSDLLNAVLLNIGLDTKVYFDLDNNYDSHVEVHVNDQDDSEHIHRYSGYNKDEFYIDQYDADNKDYTDSYLYSPENTTHLPAWIIGQDTKTQYMTKGKSIALSDSNMNKNVYSSDTSVVKVKNGKITAVNPGIAMIYRYDDKYADVFFVMVKDKGEKKTITGKVYTKNYKLFFNESDRGPFLRNESANDAAYTADLLGAKGMWKYLRLYHLQDVFNNGAKIITKYDKGIIDISLSQGENETLLVRIGDLDFWWDDNYFR